jgi:hypothetical protein
MARKTYAQLSTQAQQIKVETISKANTANRVGIMLQDLIDTLFNNGSFIPNWDMSTNLMPSGSLRGDKWYGINGPTTTITVLIDGVPQVIPNGTMAESLIDNASTTDTTQWAFTTTMK